MTFKRLLIGLGAVAAVVTVGAVAGSGGLLPEPGSQPVAQTAKEQPTPPKNGQQSKAVPEKLAPLVQEQEKAGPIAPNTDPRLMVTKRGALVLLNPSFGAPGSSVSIAGSGFDPGSTVNLMLKRNEKDSGGEDLGFAQADENGSFGGVTFSVPGNLGSGTFLVFAKQDFSENESSAKLQIRGAAPSLKLGTQVGKPGDSVTIAGSGFNPQEQVSVYFNSLTAKAVATLQADGSGAIDRAAITVPYGPSGNNTFILIGEKSQAPITANFTILNFYPSGEPSIYALKADEDMGFNGKSFGPNERVLVYLNSLSAPPIAAVQADADGSFSGGTFKVPFELEGQNTFIFVGEDSGSSVTSAFSILPYTPYAEASTYGARPGTTITFYGGDFARNEVVYIYTGRDEFSDGKLVSCAKSDDSGAVAGGNYAVRTDTPPGSMVFTLVGKNSRGSVNVGFDVMPATGNVQLPPAGPETEYKCPFDEEAATQAELGTGTATPADASAPTGATPKASGTTEPKAATTPSGSASGTVKPQASPTQTAKPSDTPAR